jgi:hypothetical protein
MFYIYEFQYSRDFLFMIRLPQPTTNVHSFYIQITAIESVEVLGLSHHSS